MHTRNFRSYFIARHYLHQSISFQFYRSETLEYLRAVESHQDIVATGPCLRFIFYIKGEGVNQHLESNLVHILRRYLESASSSPLFFISVLGLGGIARTGAVSLVTGVSLPFFAPNIES